MVYHSYRTNLLLEKQAYKLARYAIEHGMPAQQAWALWQLDVMREHGKPTLLAADRLYAWDEVYDTVFQRDASHWVDVTDWTYPEVLRWLGY
jgi:hypothetical protein